MTLEWQVPSLYPSVAYDAAHTRAWAVWREGDNTSTHPWSIQAKRFGS